MHHDEVGDGVGYRVTRVVYRSELVSTYASKSGENRSRSSICVELVSSEQATMNRQPL
jgi:hypothetical protein